MRASATSRISTAHAAHQSTQAANANKTDDTSPFALLLANTGAKDVKGQKSDAHDKDAQDDKSADAAVSKKDAPAQQTQTADAKPAKADDKAGDKTDAKNIAATDDVAAAMPADQTVAPTPDPSAVPPVMMAPQPQAAQATTITTAADTEEDATVAAAGATAAGATAADATAAKPATPAPMADAGKEAQTAQNQPLQAPGQAKTAAADTKPDAKTDAKPDNKTAAKGKDKDASADDIKPAAQGQNTAANAPPPAADKPAPQANGADNNAITAPALAATASQAPAAANTPAPVLTQHVQVTAQPAPNLPALAVEIATKSQAGSKQFDIRLDPPELGRVEVRLSIDATGKASAHLTADQPQTLDLLRKDSTSLTQALRDAGLNVNQDGLNFSLRQQAGDTNQGRNNGGRSGAGRGQMLSASKSIDATAASAAYRAPADGRLDIKV